MARSISVALELDNRDFQRGMAQADRSVNNFGKTLTGLKAGVAGLFAGIGFSALTSGLVKTYTEFEKTRTVLSTLLGSQQAASQEFSRLQTLANQLPQDLQDITDAFVILTRTGMNTSSESLKNFSNIATGTGKSMTQLAEAVADAMTGEFERLKEFGIKVEKQNGKLVASIGGQQAFVANSSAELVANLERLGATQYGEAAANNADTLDQSLSNLRGTVYQASIAFMEGLAPALKISADNMAELIQHNENFIRNAGAGVGDALRTMASGFHFLTENIHLVRNALLAMIGVRMFGNFQTQIANLGQRMGRLGPEGEAARASVDNLAKGMLAAIPPLRALIAAFIVLSGLYMTFKDSTIQMADGTTTLAEAVDALGLRITTGFGAMGDIIVAWARSSITSINEFISAFDTNFPILSDYASIVFNSISEGFKNLIDIMLKGLILLGQGMVDTAQTLPAAFDLVLLTLPKALYQFITRLGAQIKNLFDNVTSGFQTPIENMFTGMGTEILTGVKQDLKDIRDGFTETQTAAAFLFSGERVLDLQPMVDDLRAAKAAAEDLNNLEVRVTAQRRPTVGQTPAGTPPGKKPPKGGYQRSDLADFYANIEEEAKHWEKVAEELDQQRAQSLQELAAIQAQVYGEEYIAKQRLKEQQAALDQALALHLINMQQYQELMAGLQEQFRFDTGAASFSEGWTKALEDFKKQVEDTGSSAKEIFDTLANGMTDALTTFVETGKLSFRSLIQDLVHQIIKMMMNKMVLAFLDMMTSSFGGGGGGGGFFSSLFGGARAEGGPVLANKSYLVGERGPEMFTPSGAGTITPNDMLTGRNSLTQVTYNINAVDARSFKELVARDPEFIYSVSRAGARRLPG